MSANAKTGMESPKDRCSGCGMVLEGTDRAARVVMGRIDNDGLFIKKNVWATLHFYCFAMSMDSPSLALELVTGQQRNAKWASKPKKVPRRRPSGNRKP